ncbi:MAG TPA: hypothetical protein VK684_04165 [Edaphobacter sp.]|jgi:hypothetical protein|nr:hypothetical protein [Edaphobacter sp.]
MTVAGNKLTRFAMTAALTVTGLAFGQTTVPRHKVLTPEQQRYQAETAQWLKQSLALRIQAQAALAEETAREKAGDCPNADTTLATEQCLTEEITKTQSNYLTFVSSIRAMLALAHPTMPGEQPGSGPTAIPPSASERVAEFEQLEVHSKQYRGEATRAAYNQYKGGTLAPVFAAQATQRLLRLHIQELAFIYEAELENR